MEPPSPSISWVNPFPSRFINRTACFPRKVSYFRESRLSAWKKMELNEVELRSPSFDRFSFLLYFHFYNFTAAGIWVSWNKSYWITRLRLSMKRQRHLTEDHGKIIFASVVFFFFPSWIPHSSMHLEKSRRLSVLWTVWNFSMISAEKVPGSFGFCHHRGVDFAS